MKTVQPSMLSTFLRFGIILLEIVMLSVPCFSENMMILPVASQGEKDMSKPDQRLEFYSQVGKGAYVPLKLKDYQENRKKAFRTSFEECAPGRNAAANEWSAFGVIGKQDINAMGREMWVRYPAFELMFQMYKECKEINPDSLESFRLGLVENRLPAIWGAWQDNGLAYKVSVMTVSNPENGNYDLYKLEIQNPTQEPKTSDLVVGLDGSPDLRLEDGVVRGLGDTETREVPRELIKRWSEVIQEWSLRYGTRVSGWWFDGMHREEYWNDYSKPYNFKTWAAASRAGNPDSMLAFNNGADVEKAFKIFSDGQDYTAGEQQRFGALPNLYPPYPGKQWHILSYLGDFWSSPTGPNYTDEWLIDYVKNVNRQGGEVSIDVNVSDDGRIYQPHLGQLIALGNALEKSSVRSEKRIVARSILCGVREKR